MLAGAVVIAAVSAAVAGARDPRASCGEQLAQVWSPTQRIALAQHFGALGEHGVETFRVLAPVLDRYAAGWTMQRSEICGADPTDPSAARAAVCLDRRLGAFGALVDELLELDRDALEHALLSGENLLQLS